MLILAASPTGTQPDFVALVMVLALLLAVVIAALRKRFKASKPAQVTVAPVPEKAPAPAAPGSAGTLKLYDVEPKTAAMIMAIVAHKTGKPLNELRFLSIKEVTPQ